VEKIPARLHLALSHHRARARARPFFHLVFFHNSPRKARRRGRESTVAARRIVRLGISAISGAIGNARAREARDSFGQDRESVRSYARGFGSPRGGLARALSAGSKVFHAAAARSVSILFAVKQYYVVKFIARLPPPSTAGVARPYNAPSSPRTRKR